MTPLPPAPQAFDQVATRYDTDSTYLALSVWFRNLIWERMERCYPAESHLLELGCGTGEDAIWHAKRGGHVTATDASPAMLEQARQKAGIAGVPDRITLQSYDFSQPENSPFKGLKFDGVYSDYGALNCIDHATLARVAAVLSDCVKPGGIAGLCLIGRWCTWELLWHSARLRFKRAFRRVKGQAVAHLEGRYFTVYYPTPGEVARAFGAGWRVRRVSGVGVFLPPSDLYQKVGERQRLAETLLRLERWSADRYPLNHLGDHYWIELERMPG
jgi:ubiquinone/menaquinone biosynthesis C-methylase UbiE